MVSICILSWNCVEVLQQSIPLILQDLQNVLEYEIIVYDQNSDDGSVEYLKSIDGQSNIQVIFGSANCGNSISRNQMIEKAKYKYILLLDCDIIPIRNSIKCMVHFMEDNPSYAFIGYDCYSYTSDIGLITNHEHAIRSNDIINWRNKVAFSQYGLFKKEVLDKFRFPEFYPFNKPGWGAEDDILGSVIYNSGIGIGGCIKDRSYYHQKSSSKIHLGHDKFHQTHMERVIHLFYFEHFLNNQYKQIALEQQVLPKAELQCNKYHWDLQNNLGDIATDYLLQKYFPFLRFNPSEKTNLLMFGGTIFDHIENANQKYRANFTNILYFGVGLFGEAVIKNGLRMIKNKNMSLCIIPRGAKSHDEFFKHGLICQTPVGDVLQLFAMEDKAAYSENDPELFVQDVWHPDLTKPRILNSMTIKVAENGSFPQLPFYDLPEYMKLLNNVSSVYSSQIHPPLIASLLGKPATIHQKDWRVDDLHWFPSFKTQMNLYDAAKLRLEAQKNIVPFAMSFFKHLKHFL